MLRSSWGPRASGHGASLTLSFPVSSPVESRPSAEESQSGDFDDVGAGRARRGLDARGCGASRRRRGPPLRGPVEAIPVGGQRWGRREADDSRGDSTSFAVDPFIGFQVEV